MKKANIYKIINTKTDDIYIGSTVQKLKSRFKNHKSNAINGKNGYLYDSMRKNGINNFYIELIEEFYFEKKEQIGLKEKEYFMKLKPSLNMKNPNVCIDKKYGRIYKLFYILNKIEFYIGSTTKKLNDRLIDHKSFSNNGTTQLYKYMRENGKNNFCIEIIEDNIDIDNLILRENYWIQQLKPSLNTNIYLNRTEKERDQAKYQKNKEKIKKRVNDRRIAKREEINAKKKEYYEKNKERILLKQKTKEYKEHANKLRREKRKNKKIAS